MGVSHSHVSDKTHVLNGVTTIHHERIKRNAFGLTLTYEREGDSGNQKVVVTKNKNQYRVVNTYDGQKEKDDNTYTKTALLDLLNTCHLKDNLRFMVSYLTKYD